jgi:hypothetical protein
MGNFFKVPSTKKTVEYEIDVCGEWNLRNNPPNCLSTAKKSITIHLPGCYDDLNNKNSGHLSQEENKENKESFKLLDSLPQMNKEVKKKLNNQLRKLKSDKCASNQPIMNRTTCDKNMDLSNNNLLPGTLSEEMEQNDFTSKVCGKDENVYCKQSLTTCSY